jgi:ubiquinone/menaquinone biosynthesis C-methylase UbiE
VDALDVGCGTGFFALLLAGLGHRPVGVDLADAMLARAREKADAAGLDVDFRSADAEHLPFAEGSFDLVIERHVIWTLPDPPRALAEWARVLRPGGRLVLVEGDWRSPGNPDYAPIRDSLPLYGGRPAVELEALVRAHGFERTQVEPLMTAALWVEEPDRDRYALHAWV